MPVEVQQVVDAKPMGGGDERVDGDIVLQRAAGTDADDIQGGDGRFDGARGEVNVDQRVEFIEDDVDVVGADSGGDHGNSLFPEKAGVGDEFAVRGFVFDGVETFADAGYTVGVANGEDGVGDLIRTDIEVIDGASVIDDQFRFGDVWHYVSL